ncbi:MAG: TIGR04086 family membrane protein [Clostridiales bacterium]|jgi:putative membrane protein, TIGR04086 family|nr:TIGR04086 family membrane protein [Clostridiales bacterium]
MNNNQNNIVKSRYTKKAARTKAKEIRKKYNQEVHGRYYYLIKGFMISVLVSVPLFFIIALAMQVTDFPEEYMPPALLTAVLISIVIAAFYATAAAKTNGWFNGTLIGFFYMLILIIIRWGVEGRISFNKDVLTMLLAGLLIGSICGMAGLNLGEHVRNLSHRKNNIKIK